MTRRLWGSGLVALAAAGLLLCSLRWFVWIE